MRRTWLARLSLISILTWSASLHAAYFCSEVLVQYRHGGTAVELEMDLTDNILNVLTTPDGTVGGLFSPHITRAKMPTDYIKWAKENYPEMPPESIEWDLVPANLRHSMLQEVSNRKRTSFFEDRKIPGMKVKQVIKLRFIEPTRFLGRDYEKGEHEIDVSEVFKAVEYRSFTDQDLLSGIELHMRSDHLSAGELAKDAWTFQSGSGNKRTHLHEHIVVERPDSGMDHREAVAATEYYRRANLLAEVIAVAKEGRLSTNAQWKIEIGGGSIRYGRITFFGVASPHYFGEAYKYLLGQETGDLRSKLKTAFVGFRGHGAYDSNQVFGFEYRDIGAKDKDPFYTKILDHMQYGLRSRRYGDGGDQMLKWLSANDIDFRSSEEVDSALKFVWYHHSYKHIYKYLAPELKESLGGGALAYLKIMGMKLSDGGNHALKMLLYDWSRDPIYHGDSEGQARILAEQEKALKALFASTVLRPEKTLRYFVKSSGLLEKIGKTFNLTTEDLAPILK